jgi:hypothetical protein
LVGVEVQEGQKEGALRVKKGEGSKRSERGRNQSEKQQEKQEVPAQCAQRGYGFAQGHKAA